MDVRVAALGEYPSLMDLFSFVAVFVLMLVLQRWLHQHIQGLTFALTGNPGCAVRLLFFLLLPGVLLHEASHWLVANLIGVRTGAISIGLGRMKGKNFSLGSVSIERTDRFRESLIGIAPFFFGLAAIFLILAYGFDLWPNSGLTFQDILERVWATMGDPLTWLDLYLIFAVSTAMVPSESDREPWGPLIVFAAVVVMLAILTGWTPNLSASLVRWGPDIIGALTFAFGVVVVVNGTVAALVWVTEWTVAQVTQRRVRY